MFQLTKNGIAGAIAAAHCAELFEHRHVLSLPQLLHPDLLHVIDSGLQGSAWLTRDDGTIAREALPDRLAPVSILNFVANTPRFLERIREITNSSAIVCFEGRIYRMASSSYHFDSWHSDCGSIRDRLVGMSINLSRHPYQGGTFRLREKVSGKILCELPNTGPGDAIFFRISEALEHMVTPIEGTEPKTAFAGWFRSGEADYYMGLRRMDVSRRAL